MDIKHALSVSPDPFRPAAVFGCLFLPETRAAAGNGRRFEQRRSFMQGRQPVKSFPITANTKTLEALKRNDDVCPAAVLAQANDQCDGGEHCATEWLKNLGYRGRWALFQAQEYAELDKDGRAQEIASVMPT